jgi:DNA-binding transcriptional MocR family regulator
MDTGRDRPNGKRRLYEDVAHTIEAMIEKGTFGPGERIPSIRIMSRQMRVSVNTVSNAYAHLEDRRLVEARPQSGYYVRPAGPAALTERPAQPEDLAAKQVNVPEAALNAIRSLADPTLLSLASGAPNMALLPVRKLSSLLGAAVRGHPLESASYGSARGAKRLRTQIAKRLLSAGCVVAPDEVTVTSGCVEAVTLALHAVCRPGDTVAIPSPLYYVFLNAIQWLGLKVLEIPSSPDEGLSIEVLRYAIKQSAVRAVIVISNFSNPSGSLMPDDNKRKLVEALARHQIPLIEDDVYGDLGFGPSRPTSAKAYDRAGLVLHCASFSKTLAPGYRVGWIVAGRFQAKVEALKSMFNIATASPTQMAIAEFLSSGGYDRHVRRLRRTYATQMAQMRRAIGRHFPPSTRVSRPEGGSVLWVEMPKQVDAMRLYAEALKRGIGVAPGPIFTTGDDFKSCVRLSAATWSPRVDDAVETIGRLACELAG